METQVIAKEELPKIISCLQSNNIIAFPTETVFGLGCLLNDVDSLQKIYSIKERKIEKAITLMLPHSNAIEQYATISSKSNRVIRTFMPGKLTIVLPTSNPFLQSITHTPTIGIRIPNDPFVLQLLQAVGGMWVTSANLSGHQNMSTEQDVYQVFQGKIPMIVKGKTNSLVASTVVDMSEDLGIILRQGEITQEKIARVINDENSSSM